MIRVCLVEDQTLVREGLRSLLRLTDDIEVVAEASDGDEAVRIVGECSADVVVLDLRLPRRSGIEVLETLRESGKLPPTLILTTFDDDELLIRGIRGGARGFLLKDVSLDELASAIRILASGGTMFNPAVTRRLAGEIGRIRPEFPSLDPPDPLTEREIEVLRLVAAGYSNHEIAAAFGVAEGTVKNHVSSVLSKLGVRDRTRAVLKGLDLGYI